MPTTLACEILIRDFNNDGNNDISVCRNTTTNGIVSVAVNSGSGVFLPKTDFDLGVNGPMPKSMQTADFDQDGLLDIAVTVGTDSLSPNVLILFNSTVLLVGDLNGDGFVNSADLAILLGQFGCSLPATCTADLDGDGDVDAADLAILLANWTGEGSAMAQPGDMAFDDTTIIKDGAGTNQPSQNVTATVPWVIAHFGFDSVASYTGWLELLTEDELFSHIAAMLDLIANN